MMILLAARNTGGSDFVIRGNENQISTILNKEGNCQSMKQFPSFLIKSFLRFYISAVHAGFSHPGLRYC